MKHTTLIAACGMLLTLFAQTLPATVTKSLPYPTADVGQVDALELARQIYFVNHFYALKNYAITKKGVTVTVVINRTTGGRITTNTVERYLNNDYHNGKINAKDLTIFRSGKLRGTGMLITDYVDDNKSQSYVIWLPALRKIRRFSQPAHEDAWGGSDFTFGDVYLRKPYHEAHEVLGVETFNGCLQRMEIADEQRNQYTQNLPAASCAPENKQVYKLKSTTKFNDWWYDYRISYVDTQSFADYRTDFFKDGAHIKTIDRDWYTLPGYQGNDPRALTWGYWYGKNLQTGHESWAVIPSTIVEFDSSRFKSSLWSEKTLRKIKR
ncbi:outer membrane lipoprotein-sorting protein [Candidatus Venteria ishoeyi]|uniref:Uncharacterized protein TP-0789 domain-containing protein n=1 Tax=Candidatus Venteria ishoeyi TaxID=1899563 RepID=A0A1H6FFQ4_9GAMM|nr:outer membrane lipoprotein-sorting protein [Candidatus Venteria ishoeyi]MDM8547171.1 outer membrane lipoprotein-sorting protein [Candidatus Venteria ishoeyi]SEH07834.1 Uncharacterised protein [Candidatus Venteria ishoeyi]